MKTPPQGQHPGGGIAAICMGAIWLVPPIFACVLLCLVCSVTPVTAQENSKCLTCHSKRSLVGIKNGRKVSVFVDKSILTHSAHADLACVDCHTDLESAKFPHAKELEGVDCAQCHEDAADELSHGPHQKWAKSPTSPAAACISCHGHHDVLSPSDPASPTNNVNVDKLCGQCHGKEAKKVTQGAHGEHIKGGRPNASCVDCHKGHDVIKPSTEQLELETCSRCHPRETADQARSVHAHAAVNGDPLAPSCITCHNHHKILRKTDPASPTSTMNIPLLCGRCHHEGSKVSIKHDISQERILENYSLSIHGEGLFKMGLTVTAVCTSCHNSHLILNHKDPDSSINPKNIPKTCTKCHVRIAEVHVKVIEGRLWKSEPHKIPSCADCHQPHKIRRTPASPQRAANKECLRCHSDPGLTMKRNGETVSLYVNEEAYNLSTHSGVACAQCHTQVKTSLKRPCLAITKQVDCGICHAGVVNSYKTSTHGRLAARGDPDAPTCLNCHEKHHTQSHRLPTSPTFTRNVPKLCGQCHAKGQPAAKRVKATIPDIVESYVRSVHGRGLLESGLVVSASCTDCHTSHHMLPKADPESSINPEHLADTCGTCHRGIEDQFRKSIHWPGAVKTSKKLPTCEDCHTSHTITRTDVIGFRTMMMNHCGKCHEPEAETYFDTVHGKVSRLGKEGAAKCYDCHGTHNILPPTDPRSTLSHKNVVSTCAKCHPGAHRQFAGYLTHATHHDPKKYPYIFYAYWFMTILLLSTLSFFILHTLMWLWRLWRTRKQWRPHKYADHEQFYIRFTHTQRLMHLVMLLSFFTLAITGMTLKFSYMPWAVFISRLFGGFDVTGVLHRIAAVVLLSLFVFHLRQIFKMKAASKKGWRDFIFGKDSMMFNLNDIRQLGQSFKWFLGKGERPSYGRFTYWEKFDYFAVFWGIFVIGGTGIILWFPVSFTRILPGWAINVATIVHSDEALLATAFIFTIHFFNTHFRPDKFPMDMVIFTGRVALEELKHDKPEEYEALMKNEHPEKRLAGPFPRDKVRWIRIFGFTALSIGLSLIFLILYAMLFGYR